MFISHLIKDKQKNSTYLNYLIANLIVIIFKPIICKIKLIILQSCAAKHVGFKVFQLRCVMLDTALRLLFFIFLSLTVCRKGYTQKDSTLSFSSEVGGVASTTATTPFWLRVNQYGSVPSQASFAFVKLTGKALIGINPRRAQWRFQIEMVNNLGKQIRLVLPEAAVIFQYRGLEFYTGRRKEHIGLVDTLLSSGSYSWSGTALPIPKFHIGTRGFLPLKFTKNFVAIQGTFAHGWFGRQQFTYNYYMHQKTAFVRLGKPNQRWKFYAGIIHFAQWGGYAPYVGKGIANQDGYLPKSFRDFINVIFAKDSPNGGSLSQYDLENRVGNHIGSIDIAFQYKKANSDWYLYYQRPIENQAGIANNFPDGLYGIRWTSTKNEFTPWLSIRHVTAEYLTTLDQNISYNSIGNIYYGDDYFNNSQYLDGWTYKSRILGTPLISLRSDTRKEWFDLRGSYSDGFYKQINNSSVKAIYLGMYGKIKTKSEFKLRLSTNFQYIDFNMRTGKYGKPIAQLSTYFEYIRKVNAWKNTTVSVSIAKDQGQWLINSSALNVKLKKVFF